MFSYNMKRILTGKMFYICIILSAVLLYIGGYVDIEAARDNSIPLLSCLHTTQFEGVIIVVAPIIMAIPFLVIFVEDNEKKAIYFQLMRTSQRKYYAGQLAAAVCSAGAIALVSIIIFIICCLTSGVVWENEWYYTLLDDTCLRDIIYSSDIWKLTLWYHMCLVFFCMPWAVIGMVVSLFTKNKYIIIASPFVIFMAWNYLCQIIQNIWPPIKWIRPTEPTLFDELVHADFWSLKLTISYPIIYHVLLIGGLSLIYYFTIKRRFRNEGI